MSKERDVKNIWLVSVNKFKYVVVGCVKKKPKLLDSVRSPPDPFQFLIRKGGFPKVCMCLGGGEFGGLDGLHIPVGWHQTSHQRSWSNLENRPPFSKAEIKEKELLK